MKTRSLTRSEFDEMIEWSDKHSPFRVRRRVTHKCWVYSLFLFTDMEGNVQKYTIRQRFTKEAFHRALWVYNSFPT